MKEKTSANKKKSNHNSLNRVLDYTPHEQPKTFTPANYIKFNSLVDKSYYG